MSICQARTIIVCCPRSVTGGPELLHQLVHELRRLGHDAYIHYYPSDGYYRRPQAYDHYDAPQVDWRDEPDCLIVLPEVATRLAFRVRKARVVLWWLSVDSYYAVSTAHPLAKLPRVLGKATILFACLRRYTHLCQSMHAMIHLRRYGIASRILGDYLNHDYMSLAHEESGIERENLILYNPKKGAEVTKRLIQSCPEMQFVPIRNMTRAEVIQLMRRAKLYIDFGHHPGKDRMPREAAIAGCCIITGRRGSAGNSEDVPISAEYKISERNADFPAQFRRLAIDIFENFPRRSAEFTSYRAAILEEPALFRRNLAQIFGDISLTS